MTFDSAVSALEGAIESDAQAEASAPSLFRQPEAPAASDPASAPQGAEGSTGATPPQDPYNRDQLGRFAPPAEPVPAAPAEDTFAQSFDPNALTPELQAAYKQMQADYTRKTQEIAEQRRQFEQLGDHESLQAAAELYQRIQDPRYWPQLTQELSQAMQQYGIQPPGQAAQAPVAQQAPQTQGVDLSALAQDPELAPLAQHIASLQDEVAQTRQLVQQQQEQAQQEQMHMALVGEMQRQHALIQSQHPEYRDGDLDAIYELAMAHDGNLLNAQQRYEEIKSGVLSSYLDGKQQVATTPVAPVSGGGTVSNVPRKPTSLEEATDIAMETLRQAGLDTVEF